MIEFLLKVKMPVERACFDVAGPVINGRVKVTNLPWEVDEVSLARDLNFKFIHLLNDLEAVAPAVPILRQDDVRTLKVGKPIPKDAIAVVAPGTGLGESFLTWDGSKYVSPQFRRWSRGFCAYQRVTDWPARIHVQALRSCQCRARLFRNRNSEYL